MGEPIYKVFTFSIRQGKVQSWEMFGWYHHFTMVDKDAALAYYAQEDIKLYKAVLALIDRLEKEGVTNV